MLGAQGSGPGRGDDGAIVRPSGRTGYGRGGCRLDPASRSIPQGGPAGFDDSGDGEAERKVCDEAAGMGHQRLLRFGALNPKAGVISSSATMLITASLHGRT